MEKVQARFNIPVGTRKTLVGSESYKCQTREAEHMAGGHSGKDT